MAEDKKRLRTTISEKLVSKGEVPLLQRKASKDSIVRGHRIRVETTNVTRPLRRLDTLTRLLADIGNSECVVVCVINDQLFITTNELKKPILAKSTKKTKKPISEVRIPVQITKLEELLKYFRVGAKDVAQRKLLLKSICSTKYLRTLFVGGYIPDGTYEKAIEHIINYPEPEEILKFIKEGKEHAGVYAFAWGKAYEVYRDFRKMEQVVRGEAKGYKFSASSSPAASSGSSTAELGDDSEKLDIGKNVVNFEDDEDVDMESDKVEVEEEGNEELEHEEEIKEELEEDVAAIENAIKKALLVRSPNFLREESEAGVHAESQMLSKIVSMIESGEIKKDPKTIYIGISYLCCLHCHSLLKAAQKVFEDNKIPIKLKFRGAHNRTFNKEWPVPGQFKPWSGSSEISETSAASASSSSSRKKSLAQQIMEITLQMVEKERPKKAQPGTMRSSYSESDPESDDASGNFRLALQKRLEGELARIQGSMVELLAADNTYIYNTGSYNNLLKVAVILHKNVLEFKSLYSSFLPSDFESAKQSISDMLLQYSNLKEPMDRPKLSKIELLTINNNTNAVISRQKSQ